MNIQYTIHYPFRNLVIYSNYKEQISIFINIYLKQKYFVFIKYYTDLCGMNLLFI